MTRTALLTALCCLSLTACAGEDDGAGDDDLRSLSDLPPGAPEGIYQIERWTFNDESCDAEGDPAPELEDFSHFILDQDEADERNHAIAFEPCADLAACRELVAGGLIFGDHEFFENGGDWYAPETETEIYETGRCDTTVWVSSLTGRDEEYARIDIPTWLYPGECDEHGTIIEQAEQEPCDQITVVTGLYVEPL